MSQLFPARANGLVWISLGIGVFLATLGVAAWYWLARSDYSTGVNVPYSQPVPFSHQHHSGGLGIDCRYCHTHIEKMSFANVPATEVCMTCHSQIWRQAPVLQPVRDSWNNNRPIEWNRIHYLPSFVYYNHSAHVSKGIGCSECHGRIDQMPLVGKVNTLWMGWCLDCHRHPEKYVRPESAVFQMDYQHPANQEEMGRELVKAYRIKPGHYLEDCYTCHR